MSWIFKYYKIPESVIKMDFYLARENVLVQCSQQQCIYPHQWSSAYPRTGGIASFTQPFSLAPNPLVITWPWSKQRSYGPAQSLHAEKCCHIYTHSKAASKCCIKFCFYILMGFLQAAPTPCSAAVKAGHQKCNSCSSQQLLLEGGLHSWISSAQW